MTTYYVDNTKTSGVPVGVISNSTGAKCDIANPTKIYHDTGTPFVQCVEGDPFWVINTGDLGRVTIGIYIVQSVDNKANGLGDQVTLDRNVVAVGDETGIEVWYRPCDGSVPASEQSFQAGPFPTLQYAVDNADDDSTIYVKANGGYTFDNLDQPIQADACWLIDSFGGDLSENVFGQIISYGTTPGDGAETTLDADEGTVHVIMIDEDMENLIIKGFHATNTTGTGGRGLYVRMGSRNIIFENCRASVCYHGFSANTSGDVYWIGCTAFDNRGWGFISANTGCLGFLYTCEAYSNTSEGFGGVYGPVVIVNSLTHSGNGVDDIYIAGDGTVVVANCTVDGSDRHGVNVNDADSTVLLINTTVSNSTNSNFCQYSTSKGSVYAIYCNSYNGGAADVWNTGDGIMTVDPRLSGDHEILNNSLKEQGNPDHRGNNSAIGADAAVRRDQPKPVSVAGTPEGAF